MVPKNIMAPWKTTLSKDLFLAVVASLLLSFTPVLEASPGSTPLQPSELYTRKNGEIVKAPPEDLVVAQSYTSWKDKGPLIHGHRCTIMTAKSEYRPGEEVRIIHVLEAIEPGHEIYVMGPKQITNESVNGELKTPEGGGPAVYDGAVLKSPGVDFNYDISSYKFDRSGAYTIEWSGCGHPTQGLKYIKSNKLQIRISS